MTPKEKAKELIEEFSNAESEDGYLNQNHFRHKQCAIIAVNQILKVLNDYWNQDCKINNTKIGYYEEVKQKIKNYENKTNIRTTGINKIKLKCNL